MNGQPNFICENCGRKTKISLGMISLICQTCGCFDIKFSTDVYISPANSGDISDPVLVKGNDPFFGAHKDGCIWLVKRIGVEDTSESSTQSDSSHHPTSPIPPSPEMDSTGQNDKAKPQLLLRAKPNKGKKIDKKGE